jgi:hypothetical protein
MGTDSNGGIVGDFGLAEFASRKNPRLAPGMSDLCGHLFGGARRTVVLMRDLGRSLEGVMEGVRP